MYPVEPKPPNKRLADLTTVQEMFQESRDNITGYCIKSMTSDPYGHPVFAVTDGKVSHVQGMFKSIPQFIAFPGILSTS